LHPITRPHDKTNPCVETGIHTWMRDYDPTTGRYIQADLPI